MSMEFRWFPRKTVGGDAGENMRKTLGIGSLFLAMSCKPACNTALMLGKKSMRYNAGLETDSNHVETEKSKAAMING